MPNAGLFIVVCTIVPGRYVRTLYERHGDVCVRRPHDSNDQSRPKHQNIYLVPGKGRDASCGMCRFMFFFREALQTDTFGLLGTRHPTAGKPSEW